MTQIAGLAAAVFAVFGPIFWAMIFIQTYMHFPKMEPRKRLMMSLKNATVLVLVVCLGTAIALYVMLKFVLGMDV